MIRGPRPGSTAVDYVEKARIAWGDPLADWVSALAEAATANGAGKIAKRLGYSPSVISQVLSTKYAGDLGKVEQMVRGALMGATVVCPVLDEIGRDQCRREQSTPFRATNSTRARLRRACRTCSNREVKS